MFQLDLQNPDFDWDAAASQVVDVLQNGGIAVLPTDTVYGLAVSAKNENAVRKLLELKGRGENHPFALAFSNKESIADFCGELSPLAERFARRILPGPVSLVLELSTEENELYQLPEFVQQHVTKEHTVCCRIPDHPLTLTVLGELNEPLILTSANRSGQGELSSIKQIVSELGSGIDIAVNDDLPKEFIDELKPSTILKITDKQYSLLREGSLSAHTLKRLSATVIMFVCTGNICRSPMAERLGEKLLAEKLHCNIGGLEEKGYAVLSAGVAAQSGLPASGNAVEVMEEYGLDLRGHKSQRLTEQAVRFADMVFVMTREQREAILSQWHNADSRLQVLRTDGGDISDPYGSNMNVYRHCAEQLKREIEKRVKEIM